MQQEEIKPLDLLLFHGGDIISRAVSTLERIELGNGTWTHVAVVVNRTILPDVIQQIVARGRGTIDELYILESTVADSNAPHDAVTGRVIFGVQIRPLLKVVEAYKATGGGARVALARLKKNPLDQTSTLETATEYNVRLRDLQYKAGLLYSRYGHASYQFNFLDLAASLFPWLRGLCKYVCPCIHRATRRWTFCSELVARLYVDLGLMSAAILPGTVVPMDFAGYDQDGLKGVPAAELFELPPRDI